MEQRYASCPLLSISYICFRNDIHGITYNAHTVVQGTQTVVFLLFSLYFLSFLEAHVCVCVCKAQSFRKPSGFFPFPRLELSYSKLLLCGLHGTCLSLGLVGLEIICFK